ncbi:MAG: ATP-binding protein [Deltaproteobacteria bacterium]|jgi:hypothetical protein|nr:ATP-binding protein [Deltaproteobacteria bacterium]
MDKTWNLPLGNADFESIRANNFIFADKTRIIYELITKQTPFFLSRPRRFGKTLLLSVLRSIFEGRKDLFKGLWIYDQKDFNWDPSPVIHLSMGATGCNTAEKLNSRLRRKVLDIAKEESIEIVDDGPSYDFERLIIGLHDKYGKKVAILIDEYDAPIIDNLNNKALAEEMRKELKDFYGSLKNCEKQRGFIFITGISRFAKTSIFSGLNNLSDLTLNEDYANILGFTSEEFDNLFKARMEAVLNYFISKKRYKEIKTVDDLKKRILEWYDGYSWEGESSVLNPWAVLSFFDRKEFGNFWLETGHPSFIAEMIKSGQINLSHLYNDNFFKESMNIIDIGDKLNLKALLFQAGYLTIARTERLEDGIKYFLNFPNLEVRASMAQLFLSLNRPIERPLLLKKQGKAILETLINRDASGFKLAFKSFIGNFSYRSFTYTENFYSMIFTLAITFSGQLCEPQKEVEGGVMDLHLRSRYGDDFVIEIKYVPFQSTEDDNSADEIKELMEKARDKAFEQIERNRYYFCFQGNGNKIYKTALVFGGRSAILIDFQEARNWRLEWDEYHNTYSVKSPNSDDK